MAIGSRADAGASHGCDIRDVPVPSALAHPRPSVGHGLSLRARRAVAGCAAFVGLGAVYGGVSLLTDAEGFGMREEWLDGSPFPDYTVPGVVLLAGIGGGMLLTVALALRDHRLAAPLALGEGVGVCLFLAVETATIGLRSGAQLVLLPAVGLPAVVLAVLGARSFR